MPIDIEPTETTKPAAPVTFIADKLFVDAITINSDKATGDAGVSITNTPYADTAEGRVFASESDTLTTMSAFKLAAIVPQVGVAIMAIYAANAAWRARHKANKAALAAERTAADERTVTAAAAVTAADAAYEQATAARQAAYAARVQASKLSEDDPEKPAKVAAANAAWEAADSTWQAATVAKNDATANVAAVQAANAARLKIAEAAVADTANPPLTEAPE